MKYISKLTKKQEKAMVPYAKKWIAIGLKTGKTDWETFDKYMPICYQKADLQYPKNVVKVQSPLVGALASSVANAIWVQKDGAVRGAVRDAVRGVVRGAVGVAVGDAVRDVVRDAVGDVVGGAVRGAVDGAVDGAVGGAVKTSIAIEQKAGVTLSWHYWLGGQFWVGGYWYWGVAFVNFFFDVCKLKLSKDIMDRALAYRKVCESVNYIWANRDFVMVCARPVHIDKDEQGRLHSEFRMAIQYPDGWGLYMWHGVKVSEKIILHPEKITKNDWMNEKNIEVRRCIQEKLGERFVKMMEAKQIHKDSFGKLLQIDLPNDPDKEAFYVHVKDSSTKREYYLHVDPQLRPMLPNGSFGEPQELTARNAVASTFGLRGEQYKPVKES